MRTLIVVRHGNYSGSQLNETGRTQIEQLRGRMLALLLPGTAILSSNAPRAVESAEILAAAAGLTPVQYAELYSDGSTAYDVARVFALALKHGMEADTVVIVTHHEIIARLPAYVGQQLHIDIPSRSIDRGNGVIIDLQDKTYEYVP